MVVNESEAQPDNVLEFQAYLSCNIFVGNGKCPRIGFFPYCYYTPVSIDCTVQLYSLQPLESVMLPMCWPFV